MIAFVADIEMAPDEVGGADLELRNVVKSCLDRVQVVVRSTTLLARDTLAVEFAAVQGDELPAFEAGAHVDLFLPNGICRSYSLCNPPSERHRYVVGVKKACPSRGASSYIHDCLRAGQSITLSVPRNNFPLDQLAQMSVFIAGGIGITPIWSMIQKLEMEGRAWKLYYAARTRMDAAFRGDLEALEASAPGRVDIRFDHEPGSAILDLNDIVAKNAGNGTHFYACGPAPMLDAFEAATKELPAEMRHLERFTADVKAPSAAALTRYEAVLAKSGMTLPVGPDKSLLDTLLDAGVQVDFSCMEGVCGSCKVAVIEGMPDHRDVVLSDDERARNDVMLVCCSGSRTDRLVLNI